MSAGVSTIRRESNQPLSTILASLRYLANAVTAPTVGVVAHEIGPVAALATAVPAALVLVALLAPRR
jgi:hypothetical protein